MRNGFAHCVVYSQADHGISFFLSLFLFFFQSSKIPTSRTNDGSSCALEVSESQSVRVVGRHTKSRSPSQAIM